MQVEIIQDLQKVVDWLESECDITDETDQESLLDYWGIEESEMKEEEITFEEIRVCYLEEKKKELESEIEHFDRCDLLSYHRRE